MKLLAGKVGKPAHAMTNTIVSRHWAFALAACAVLVLSVASIASASTSYGTNYQYSYPYGTSYNYGTNYQYTNPYNSNYSNYYYGGQYAYPTNINYYPYGSHPSHQSYTRPSCSITITPATGAAESSYRWGYPMLLTWSASNATSASISPEVGSVTPTGSRIVYAKGSTYSMSVYGPGGTATCQTASYNVPFYTHGYGSGYNTNYYSYPNSYYTPTYTYPTTYTSGAANVVNNYVVGSASSVSLKQIPYTGLDFGVWGSAFMYLAIALSAAVGAYALVRRNRIFANVRGE